MRIANKYERPFVILFILGIFWTRILSFRYKKQPFDVSYMIAYIRLQGDARACFAFVGLKTVNSIAFRQLCTFPSLDDVW